MIKNKNHKKGITLLVAVLITSLALLFSVAITNIALKEVILTQLGKDSQIAFYASNSGIECALFWDLREDAFNTTTPLANISCSGQTVNIDRLASPPPSSWEFTTEDVYFDGLQSGPCFNLYVKKEEVTENSETFIRTTTESRGYNTCSASARRLERALRATY